MSHMIQKYFIYLQSLFSNTLSNLQVIVHNLTLVSLVHSETLLKSLPSSPQNRPRWNSDSLSRWVKRVGDLAGRNLPAFSRPSLSYRLGQKVGRENKCVSTQWLILQLCICFVCFFSCQAFRCWCTHGVPVRILCVCVCVGGWGLQHLSIALFPDLGNPSLDNLFLHLSDSTHSLLQLVSPCSVVGVI